MLASVVFVPSAPLLVPDLAGPQAFDTEAVRSATVSACRELASAATRWIAIGVRDSESQQVGTTGSFLPYGVDVPVTLGTAGSGSGEHSGSRDSSAAEVGLPLSMLIAGWLRAQVGARQVTPVTVSPCASPADCERIGAELGVRLDAAEEPVGVLVVGDGATALSARAPGGGLRESAMRLQRRIDDAIGAADTATLAELDVTECARDGASGRAAWQITASLCRDRPVQAETRYAQAPFGVGYVVAVWTPR